MLPRSRWLELRPLLKASSIVGLTVGGIGSWKTFSILSLTVPPIPWALLVFLVMFLLLGGPLAFVSSLCLVFLKLSDEQNDILGFLSLIGSVSILVVLPFFALAST